MKLHAIFQSYLAVGLAKLGYLWYSAGEGLIYYGIEDETSSNMAVKMYGVFQSRSQGPLSLPLSHEFLL